MNDAYDDLKKQMDLAKVELPEDADDPIMLELNQPDLEAKCKSMAVSMVRTTICTIM